LYRVIDQHGTIAKRNRFIQGMKNAKKITVGIDIRDLQVAKTGQKTVLEELCRQFRNTEDPRFHFVFFNSGLPVYTGKKKHILLFEHLRYQCWKQVVLPIKAWLKGCDIVFCVDYFVPYIRLGFQTVQIFHDAFFFEYPDHYNRLWLKLFHHIAMPAARKCAYIVTVSEYAREKIQYHAGFPNEKLVTIYPGPKTLDNKNTSPTLPDKYGIKTGEKYMLHVGVIEKRKNLPLLINALKILTEEGYSNLKLVLVGKGNGKKFSDDTDALLNAIRENKLEKNVCMAGYLSDRELAPLYSHAYMYVFPSINEGFGIPVLEAFTCQLPVLVGNNSSLPEVGGDAVLSFDPFNEKDIAAKIKMVLENDSLRKELISKGQERLTYFSWEKTALQFMDVFEKAHKR
jgi:glycosyltransferase involved in cell wall biosynthesis